VIWFRHRIVWYVGTEFADKHNYLNFRGETLYPQTRLQDVTNHKTITMKMSNFTYHCWVRYVCAGN